MDKGGVRATLPTILLNVVVFLNPRMRSVTSVYVIGFSVCQLIYIATNVMGLMKAVMENPSNNYVYLFYG